MRGLKQLTFVVVAAVALAPIPARADEVTFATTEGQAEVAAQQKKRVQAGARQPAVSGYLGRNRNRGNATESALATSTASGAIDPNPLCSRLPGTRVCDGIGWAPISGIPGVDSYLAEPVASAPAAPGQPAAAAPPPPDPYVLAQSAVARIQLPAANPSVAPDPSKNEWNMLAVGLPVWFTADQRQTIDASTTQQGIAISLVASRSTTTFDLGDGTTITCTSMTPRPEDAPAMAKSPDCGHTYLKAGTYTVRATVQWDIGWSALGQSGTIPMERSDVIQLEVGELTSQVVR